MKLIVGLGNPGAQYERTRHNAGFMAVDRLIARHASREIPRSRFGGMAVEARLPFTSFASEAGVAGAQPDDRCLLLKPLTYMNRSGQSVAEAVRFYKLNPAFDLLVIVDDIALACGSIRLRPDGGAGGHNGLTDIERCLGTTTYGRCRIGIDPPGVIPQADYVLGTFTQEQFPKVQQSIDKAADAAEAWFKRGMTQAMNVFNAPPPRPKPPRPPELQEHQDGQESKEAA